MAFPRTKCYEVGDDVEVGEDRGRASGVFGPDVVFLFILQHSYGSASFRDRRAVAPEYEEEEIFYAVHMKILNVFTMYQVAKHIVQSTKYRLETIGNRLPSQLPPPV